MAGPELVIPGCIYSAVSADIYACGVILYFLLTGDFPFKGDSKAELIDRIIQNRPSYPEYLSHQSREVIDMCLKQIWYDRPSASQILNMPLLERNQSEDPEQGSE